VAQDGAGFGAGFGVLDGSEAAAEIRDGFAAMGFTRGRFG
jgi:hypothetical protein